jgi:hypothetical protein
LTKATYTRNRPGNKSNPQATKYRAGCQYQTEATVHLLDQNRTTNRNKHTYRLTGSGLYQQNQTRQQKGWNCLASLVPVYQGIPQISQPINSHRNQTPESKSAIVTTTQFPQSESIDQGIYQNQRVRTEHRPSHIHLFSHTQHFPIYNINFGPLYQHTAHQTLQGTHKPT